jgi:pheromone shutdown-related protein TraB
MSTPDLTPAPTTPSADPSADPSAYTDAYGNPLPPNVTRVEVDGRTLYIVGTAHVSEESVREVELVIDQVRPDTVCVELCEPRYQALTDESRWRKLDIFKVILEGKTLFLLANLAIGAYQRRLGAKLGIKPGAELLAAVKKAEAVGAQVKLIDRDISVTLRRTWGNIRFWKKLALIGGIVESLFAREGNADSPDAIDAQQIEALKQRAHLTEMMEEFSRHFPQVHKPLIDERDRYLISGAREAPGQSIVVVVGAGHVPGMQRYLHTPIDRAALATLPPPGPWGAIAKWIIPALIIAAFFYGATKAEGQSWREMLAAWIIPNTVMAMLMTTIAGGTLISILAAGLASPITSLNPLIGAGMVVGVVEAWRRKPTVEDAERINDDVQSWRGFYKNAFTRVLLVAIAANIGSALGAWVGGAWLLAILS